MLQKELHVRRVLLASLLMIGAQALGKPRPGDPPPLDGRPIPVIVQIGSAVKMSESDPGRIPRQGDTPSQGANRAASEDARKFLTELRAKSTVDFKHEIAKAFECSPRSSKSFCSHLIFAADADWQQLATLAQRTLAETDAASLLTVKVWLEINTDGLFVYSYVQRIPALRLSKRWDLIAPEFKVTYTEHIPREQAKVIRRRVEAKNYWLGGDPAPADAAIRRGIAEIAALIPVGLASGLLDTREDFVLKYSKMISLNQLRKQRRALVCPSVMVCAQKAVRLFDDRAWFWALENDDSELFVFGLHSYPMVVLDKNAL